MITAKIISQRIRELAYKKNISLNALQIKSGVPSSTFNCLIYYTNKSVNLKTLFAILKVLDIEMHEFVNSPLFDDENLDIQ